MSFDSTWLNLPLQTRQLDKGYVWYSLAALTREYTEHAKSRALADLKPVLVRCTLIELGDRQIRTVNTTLSFSESVSGLDFAAVLPVVYEMEQYHSGNSAKSKR